MRLSRIFSYPHAVHDCVRRRPVTCLGCPIVSCSPAVPRSLMVESTFSLAITALKFRSATMTDVTSNLRQTKPEGSERASGYCRIHARFSPKCADAPSARSFAAMRRGDDGNAVRTAARVVQPHV